MCLKYCPLKQKRVGNIWSVNSVKFEIAVSLTRNKVLKNGIVFRYCQFSKLSGSLDRSTIPLQTLCKFSTLSSYLYKRKAFSFSERSIAALSVLQDWLKTQLKSLTLSAEMARLFAGLHHVVWKSLAVSSLCIAWAVIVPVFTATGILF